MSRFTMFKGAATRMESCVVVGIYPTADPLRPLIWCLILRAGDRHLIAFLAESALMSRTLPGLYQELLGVLTCVLFAGRHYCTLDEFVLMPDMA